MPSLRNYDLFISHAWRYNEAYYRLVNLLDTAPYFQYRNYSVPTHDPLVDPDSRISETALANSLDRQIRPVQCVLVIAGMYAAHRFWIDKEITFAQMYNKPIVGLIPWGQERIPMSVQVAAREMVGWNTDSIVGAIRRCAL
ncbi:TIR domain-containing protein [Variovorax sp. YR216]|uniref:TIR domain-containing protein n=1 Tax=Variovorax sp. YR216 TaxID=1882828 RepID=UPI000896A607|nr:TIR domain-containing protein [Variovorax sp. YR216]SEB22712.1 MTH538 TIR-like domain [Variovorax sp. YR216]